MADLDTWDITAANNNDAPPDGWPEATMQYSEVNNTGREGMAVIARFWKDTNGELQLAGSVNVYTLTLNATYAAYFQGMYFAAEVNITNTGAVTLNVNGIGAQTVVSQGGSALASGTLIAGGIYVFRYDGTNFQVSETLIEAGSISLAMLEDMATDSFIGRDTAGTGVPEVLTATQVRTIINVADGATVDQTSIVGITGTGAQFNTAITDQNIAFAGGAFHDGFSDFVADRHVLHAGVNFSANDGLTGGGTIAASRSFAVDSTVIRTTGNQSMSGVKTFTGTIRAANGSAGTPSYGFTGDINSGMFNSGSNILRWACNGIERMTLSSVGALVCDDDITAFSDRRLKANLQTIAYPLDKIMAINGYTFDRTDHLDPDTGENLDTKRHAGVIAQEVEIVLPEVIHTNEDGVKSTAYGNMAALFIEAIKELTLRLEALENGMAVPA